MLLPLFEYHLFELTQFQRLIFSLEFLKSALFKFCICRLHSLLWVFVHLLILDNAQHLDCLAHRACTCAFYLNPAAMQFKRKVLQVTCREKRVSNTSNFMSTLSSLSPVYIFLQRGGEMSHRLSFLHCSLPHRLHPLRLLRLDLRLGHLGWRCLRLGGGRLVLSLQKLVPLLLFGKCLQTLPLCILLLTLPKRCILSHFLQLQYFS